MSRPNFKLNDFMGLFRSGLLACLVVGLTAVAQQPSTNGPGVPVADPNVPVPAPIPQPGVTPEVDPNALQPAPTTDIATPAPTAGATNKPKAKKPAATAPALPTLRGTLGSIDKTNMTIVVHGKSKDETLSITSKTRIFADNKPAILSDAKDGENVVVEYRNTKEKTKEALTLRLGGNAPTAASIEKSATDKPAAKKPKTTKATAKKKSAKPAKPTDNATPAPETVVTPLPDTNTPPVVAPQPTVPAPNPANP
jgi:hypothetical protein